MPENTRLREIFAEIDSKARNFAEASCLSCPAGCGKCCADTEASAIEADIIANYIVENAPELKSCLDRKGPECIFYDRDSDLHCRIYEVRPLICRCFGYSAELDKLGSLLFPACQHMDLPDGLRSGGGVIRILFEPHPPVMAEYRSRIQKLQNGNRKMSPLAEAVKDAVARI